MLCDSELDSALPWQACTPSIFFSRSGKLTGSLSADPITFYCKVIVVDCTFILRYHMHATNLWHYFSSSVYSIHYTRTIDLTRYRTKAYDVEIKHAKHYNVAYNSSVSGCAAAVACWQLALGQSRHSTIWPCGMCQPCFAPSCKALWRPYRPAAQSICPVVRACMAETFRRLADPGDYHYHWSFLIVCS